MKKIIFGKPFRTAYQNRIASHRHLVKAFRQKLKLFVKDRTAAEFDDHVLIGKLQGLRAFSVSYDLRVIYEETSKTIILIDIGSHRQVYR